MIITRRTFGDEIRRQIFKPSVAWSIITEDKLMGGCFRATNINKLFIKAAYFIIIS